MHGSPTTSELFSSLWRPRTTPRCVHARGMVKPRYGSGAAFAGLGLSCANARPATSSLAGMKRNRSGKVGAIIIELDSLLRQAATVKPRRVEGARSIFPPRWPGGSAAAACAALSLAPSRAADLRDEAAALA